MIQLNAPFLPNKKIIEIVEGYLKEHKLFETIPVPVEEHLDLKLGINIIPIPGLQTTFEVEGFTSSDLTSIYVDDNIAAHSQTRYRFTLAHELGHIVMHADLLRNHSFSNIIQWKEFQSELDERDRSKIEYQGYTFGGLLLVPQHHLRRVFSAAIPEVEEMVNKAKSAKCERDAYIGYAIDNLARILAPKFEVSIDVMNKRIRFDSLDKLIP